MMPNQPRPEESIIMKRGLTAVSERVTILRRQVLAEVWPARDI
jgi:hypothetical protein